MSRYRIPTLASPGRLLAALVAAFAAALAIAAGISASPARSASAPAAAPASTRTLVLYPGSRGRRNTALLG